MQQPSPAATPDFDDDDESEPSSPVQNPAKALAGIIAQRTGGGAPVPAEISREPASPPLPSRPQQPVQYTPEYSDEEAPPPKPQRPRSEVQYDDHTSSRAEPPGVIASPPYNRAVADHYDEGNMIQSAGGFKLFHVHEMVSSMGKKKKMPTTLGINLARGLVSISPARPQDGATQEWTAEKLSHYSIEGKHVFVDLVRPSKNVDLHAGAKDTAAEITSMLGEIAGASRAGGLREVLAAASGGGGQKSGHMLYEFMAQGDDEVTVAVGDEIIVLDDTKSDDWWMIRRLKNGKEGVVPSSYVEVTGTVPTPETTNYASVNAGRSTVEQNRREEERLAREAARRDEAALPARMSSLATGEQESHHHKKKHAKESSKSSMYKPEYFSANSLIII